MIRRILQRLPEPIKPPFRQAFALYGRGRTGLRVSLGLERDRQIIVCGFPRGGTSLFYNMLSATLPRFRFAEFEEPAVHSLQLIGNCASKFPLDVLDLPRLAERNPHRKRLIALIVTRDPRDVVTSRHPLLPEEYFVGYEHSWWPQDRQFESWVHDAAGLKHIDRAIRRTRHLTDIESMIVPFEEIVAEPDSVQERLIHAFGLPFDENFSDYHTRPQRLAYRYEGRRSPKDSGLVRENRPADRRRVGKWRSSEHFDRIAQQVSAHPEFIELVRHYGYESDDAWASPYLRGREAHTG